MNQVVPRGYLTLERALEHFGQLKHPDEWEAEKVSSKREFQQHLFDTDISAEVLTDNGILHALRSSVWGSVEAERIFETGRAGISVGNEYLPDTVNGRVVIKQSSIDALSADDSDGLSQSPEAISDGATTGPTKQSNRGRPTDWPRKLWVECLLDLSLRGEVSLADSQESIAEALASEVENVTGKKPSVNTVKKDWLRPFLKKAKKGGNSSD